MQLVTLIAFCSVGFVLSFTSKSSLFQPFHCFACVDMMIALLLFSPAPSFSRTQHVALPCRNGITIFVSAGEDNIKASTYRATLSESDTAMRNMEAEAEVIVLAKESPVEAAAVQQLHWVAKLPGVCLAVGLPDLHPGTILACQVLDVTCKLAEARPHR